MLYNKITFANSVWLWGLLLIPFVVLFFKMCNSTSSRHKRLADFADPELLSHLLQDTPPKTKTISWLTLWCLLWLSGIVAMAGPRWRFVEYETYQPEAALVIVLDLSQSMQAEDLMPSRLVRGTQQIQDILAIGRGIRVGLIGFAKFPHLITPITDDFATILHLLPAVDVTLIHKQGKDLNAALILANKLLAAEPGDNKHILIISDGNFKPASTSTKVKIHVAAVGTEAGAPYKNAKGAWHKDHGKIVVSKVQINTLKALAKSTGGKFWQINYGEVDTASLVKQLRGAGIKDTSQGLTKVRQWDEGFAWLLFPMLFLALLLRHKYLHLSVYVFVIGWCCMPQPSFAIDLLHNADQQGQRFFNNGDYEQAAAKFADPYRKGVALYKAGQFAAAEVAFAQAQRPNIKLKAKFNLGNAQLKQKKYKLAIDSYKSVLTEKPDYQAAAENLAIARKLLKDEPPCNCKNKKPGAKDEQDQNKDNDGQSNKEKTKQNKDKQNKDKQENANNNATKATEAKTKQEQVMTTEAQDGKVDPETEVWLKRMDNDIKIFLKNKFLIEEQNEK